MKHQLIYAFEKRVFLNPGSTHLSTFIQDHVEQVTRHRTWATTW